MNSIQPGVTKQRIADALVVLADFTNRYCRHHDDCSSRESGGECNCGYDEALHKIKHLFAPLLTAHSDKVPVAIKRALQLPVQP